MDPLELDWTSATIEQYSEKHKTAIHVFNHDLSTPDAVDRTIRFAIGRARWFKRQLPPGTTQGAQLDDRGQRVLDADRKRIREALSAEFIRVGFFSESKK